MSVPPAPVGALPRKPARRPVRVDPLAEDRCRLARTEPSPELLIMLRAAGFKGEVYSALHALELLGTLASGREVVQS